ncbi:hypothetical protein BJ138DRAFT_1104681 [Hygrophoropsis aurantiaca]|uniref:Uncharacterized protein n=1 Tax=Hygrophoropsis aurantiaca TaxID=72124 RepID=A0ACB8A0X2_9AGAM|nr:hypothetical protein BJ138DRAFT_1104681 [Hygrophoropsis aurantiaca]
MALLRPRLRLDSSPSAPPTSFVQAVGSDEPPHTHVSSFRSLLLEMHIYSPSVKMVRQPGTDSLVSRPVFGDHNRVEGKVMLDPSCGQNGRLTISIEGAFEYNSAKTEVDDEFPRPPEMVRHKHVFLSSSAVIPISPSPELRSTLREAFGVRKRPSVTNMHAGGSRSCEFNFEIPRGNRPGEEMPPTFSSTTLVDNIQNRSFVEKADVTYRVTAIWDPVDESETSAILEAPIVFQPDTDFQSLDGSAIEPESWLEMPLKWERPIPFQCHVTLPTPHTFSRCTSIPYYVVFTTTPRSPTLAREIAADATIAVSLVRKITINPQHPMFPPTPPATPPPSDESDTASPITLHGSRSKLLKRAAKTIPQARVKTPRTPDEPFAAAVKYKPLPQLPTESFSESRILQTQICIGFPKRPRRRNPNSPSTPEPRANLPDGLYKGKISLSKDMLPGVDWPGLSVKYYLDVSVLFGQDDVRARIPIRLL